MHALLAEHASCMPGCSASYQFGICIPLRNSASQACGCGMRYAVCSCRITGAGIAARVTQPWVMATLAAAVDRPSTLPSLSLIHFPPSPPARKRSRAHRSPRIPTGVYGRRHVSKIQQEKARVRRVQGVQGVQRVPI